MSFALTTKQFRNGTKTVTRRLGWRNLKAGDLFCAVVKGMGLKKGEKVERLGVCRVVSVRRELLCEISPDDVRKEGFTDMPPLVFVDMFCKHHSGCNAGGRWAGIQIYARKRRQGATEQEQEQDPKQKP